MKAAAALAVLAACAGAPVHPRVVHDETEARQAIGQVVELQGTAQDLKAGGAATTEALTVVCLNVDSWPGGWVGQPVKIRGRLEQSQKAPEGDEPIHEQRANGPTFQIPRCEWSKP